MIKTLGLSIVTAGIIGAGVLGLAGTAAAATTTTTPSGPGYSYSPEVKAHPAPTMAPGWHAHHGAGGVHPHGLAGRATEGAEVDHATGRGPRERVRLPGVVAVGP